MTLTAENTAIVLDSTADLPDAAERFPNWRVVPLYVNFGDESLRDGVDITRGGLLRKAARVERLPDDVAADAGRLPRLLPRARRVRADPLAACLGAGLGHLRERGDRSGRARRTAGCAQSTPRPRRRRSRCSRSRSSAGSSAARATRRSTRSSSDIGESAACCSPSTRSSSSNAAGRIGKAAAFAGTLLHVKPILSIRDGEVEPIKRVRGERKAFAELAAALETETRDEPEFRLGVAHAAAPERAAELEALVRERRPQAELELVVTLGAVIGAHAGPGTLALFWFHDEV